MSIFLPYPDPFDCAICGKTCGAPDAPMWQRLGSAHRRDLPPICWSCEQDWGYGGYAIDVMLDHRLKRQISALANVLQAEAARRAAGYGGHYA